MNKLILKLRLLNKCIDLQQQLVDDFNQRLENLKESERMSNEEELDGGHLAQKVQMDSEVMTLNDQLEFASKELRFLFDLKDVISTEETDVVCPGAVVETDRGVFFVSASIEEFRMDGKSYFGLSTKSPLYQAMKGKTKGSSILLNNTAYTIQDVF